MAFKFSVISNTATFLLASNPATTNEGTSSTITLTTTGVQNGQAIPYVISGTGITSADISGASLTGNMIVQNNSASVTLNIANDVTTEGFETLIFTIQTSNSSMAVTVGINDTSLSTDPYWSSTSMLLHFDGTNNSTTFVDATGKVTVTASSGAVISNNPVKFGTGSYKATDGGAMGANLSQNAGLTLTGDFTIESWCYQTSTTQRILLGSNIDKNHQIQVNQGNTVGRVAMYDAVIGWQGGTASLPTNTWFHLAFVRSAGTVKIYLDGASFATYSNSNTYDFTGGTIGNRGSSGTGWVGSLDEFRITKGIARYTSDFTAPIAAFLNS
jgi:hypothetical protein